jgi:mRNA interferase MazF
MKRGEIWLVNLDPIIGREQAGTRPALIVSADSFNASGLELVIVCPLTSKYKGFPTHVDLKMGEAGLTQDSYIKTEDIRSISLQRLVRKMGTVDANIMHKVESIMKKILAVRT